MKSKRNIKEQMLKSLLDYAGTGDFTPSHILSVKQLDGILLSRED
jgi:hypothetical protein